MKKTIIMTVCLFATVAQAGSQSFNVVKQGGQWIAKSEWHSSLPFITSITSGTNVVVKVTPGLTKDLLDYNQTPCEVDRNETLREWNVKPSCAKSGDEFTISFSRKNLETFQLKDISASDLPDDSTVTLLIPTQDQPKVATGTEGNSTPEKKKIQDRDPASERKH